MNHSEHNPRYIERRKNALARWQDTVRTGRYHYGGHPTDDQIAFAKRQIAILTEKITP